MPDESVRWLAFVKQDCPTCRLVEPVLGQLAGQAFPLTVYSQDDPTFPQGVPGVVDDTELEQSYRFNIEIVPTLIRLEQGKEVERLVGWNRAEPCGGRRPSAATLEPETMLLADVAA